MSGARSWRDFPAPSTRPVDLRIDAAVIDRHPNVRLALARLLDELTIAKMWDESNPHGRKVVQRAKPVVGTYRVRESVLRALTVGPSPVRWLAETVYATVPPDRRPYKPETAVATVCLSLLASGDVVRVRRGWYALNRPGVQIADFATFAAWAARRPQGVTIHDAVERFPEMTRQGLKRWLQRLSEQSGAASVVEPTPDGKSHRCRYFAARKAG